MNRLKGGVVCLLLFVLIEVTLQQDVGGLWKWRHDPNYRITMGKRDPKNFIITVADGNLGPYRGTINGDKLDVAFGSKCCNGTVTKNGTKIEWSNKTSWTKSGNKTKPIKPRTPKPTQPDDLLRIADALGATRAKILELTAEVKQHLDAAVAYSRAQNRPASVITDITKSHNYTQESLKAAHAAVGQLETNIRSAGSRKSTALPRPTTTRKPTGPTKPDLTANEPAGRLKAFVQKALETGKSEAATDVRHIDALIKTISERRTKALKRRLEEKDKMLDQRRKEKEARSKKRKEDRAERRKKKEDARNQRRVAYEHFRKRDPSQAELDRLEKLREEERQLRRSKNKAEKRKRREESKKKRKERRKEEKDKRSERRLKRETEWREGMTNITREVESVARKTVITVGHTIQSLEEALTQASNQLEVLQDACRQGNDLKARYAQSRVMTEKMKALAVKTINSLKAARKYIDIEEKKHMERVEQREKETEKVELEERLEARNKRRLRRRKHEARSKKERAEREKGRKERGAKRSEEKRKRDRKREREQDDKRALDDMEKKAADESKKKREEKRKEDEKEVDSTQLVSEVKKTLEGVVNETDTRIREVTITTTQNSQQESIKGSGGVIKGEIKGEIKGGGTKGGKSGDKPRRTRVPVVLKTLNPSSGAGFVKK